MLKLVVNNNKTEEEEEQPQLKPDWRGPIDGDWLSGMKTGTEFLVRDKTGRFPRWVVHEFTHAGKLKGNVLICPTATLNDPKTWQWVDPVEFCRAFEFRGIVEVPEDNG